MPVTYVNARASKTDRGDRNLETQVCILEAQGISKEHILRDGRNELMSQVRLKKSSGLAFENLVI